MGCIARLGCLILLVCLGIGAWFTRDKWLPRITGKPVVTRTASGWEPLTPEAGAAGKRKLEENRCPDAFDHLREAIRIYGGYGDAHRAMGECYARMKQPEAAEQEFKQALEQIHRPDLHLKLATIYAERDDEPQMLRQIEFYVAEESPNSLRDRMQSLLDKYGHR